MTLCAARSEINLNVAADYSCVVAQCLPKQARPGRAGVGTRKGREAFKPPSSPCAATASKSTHSRARGTARPLQGERTREYSLDELVLQIWDEDVTKNLPVDLQASALKMFLIIRRAVFAKPNEFRRDDFTINQ